MVNKVEGEISMELELQTIKEVIDRKEWKKNKIKDYST